MIGSRYPVHSGRRIMRQIHHCCKDWPFECLARAASSSPCERLWSNFGTIESKKRNRLGVQKANDLVFVNANLRLLKKFRAECTPEPFIGFSLDLDDNDGEDQPEGEDDVEQHEDE